MIVYVTGDATQPRGEGHKIIVHICNDTGRWGKGFVLAISRRWKKPENAYRQWHEHPAGDNRVELGKIQPVRVSDDITVINMIAQKGIYRSKGVPPIRYEAVRTCLKKVSSYAAEIPDNPVTIHMPRIGCGLAGGSWPEIEKIINETLTDFDVVVYGLG
ncbi:MAG: macro domain-containing protein [Deltaproteobacteria bacterium]|nr:macro domain-containing protein [Deltaproteobacteria bacterium]